MSDELGYMPFGIAFLLALITQILFPSGVSVWVAIMVLAAIRLDRQLSKEMRSVKR
jgi:hypothetical protein